MTKDRITSEVARQNADSRFRRAKQREGEAQSAYEEQTKRQEAERVKTKRLRTLRLAKEAADADLAAQAKTSGENAPRKSVRLVPKKQNPT